MTKLKLLGSLCFIQQHDFHLLKQTAEQMFLSCMKHNTKFLQENRICSVFSLCINFYAQLYLGQTSSLKYLFPIYS